MGLSVIEGVGDLFNTPPCTLIIHACNCIGSWDAGIAVEFKRRYPCAYNEYMYTCNTTILSLVGTSRITLPEKIFKDQIDGVKLSSTDLPSTHFIGCIFTSNRYGKFKDSELEILQATHLGINDLLQQVTHWNRQINEYTKIKQIVMCRINSGYFGVPWHKTKEVLENINVNNYSIKEVKIFSL